MTENKKQCSRSDQPDMHLHDTVMPDMDSLMPERRCPMNYSCPFMCPMICPMISGQMMNTNDTKQRNEAESMRSPDWYEEEDSDYSSDESDEFPDYWKYKKKYKYSPYPIFCPSFYSVKPHKKKHKKW